jgi:hypothetical protein
MKYFSLFSILIFVFACGSPSVKKEDRDSLATTHGNDSIAAPPAPEVVSLPADFKGFDLPSKVVKGKVMCPAGADVYTAGLDDNEGARDEIVIQTGDTGMMIDMYSTKYDMKTCLDKVRSSMWTPLRSLISSDEHLSVFTRAGANDPKKTSFDFILLIEKDGQRWHIQPSDSEDYTKEQIELLLAIAKSVQL